MRFIRHVLAAATIGSLVCVLADSSTAKPLPPQEAATRINRLLASEAPSQATAESTPQADDETFLRRVYLDLVGELPRPEEITAFSLDGSPNKRREVVDRLLADSRYGANWARYWRDVILFRRSDQRALLAAESVTRYLTEEFNRGTSWKQIATEFLTAQGNLAEEGRTALLASQWGETSDTTAEVSRILMGVQIQCAQCHDHKTDRWKREQFHQLAAFLPRFQIRRVEQEGKRISFQIVSKDGDGTARRKAGPNQKANRRLEHYMPNLEDPAAEGTLMQPVFFLTGAKLEPGASDRQRRQQLAEWITSRDNPWFARAVVNRIWAELVGEGFYEPIDDLGPDKNCTAPKTLDLLARQFVEHDYDLKWLFRAITATEIYGRPSHPRRNPDQAAFAAVCPQPLRADQLFNNLAYVLSVPEEAPENMKRAGVGEAAARFLNSPRGRFIAAFGFDPSAPRDELSGSIDQALLMMNTPALSRAISARGTISGGPTLLAQLLADEEDDETVIVELYLRCLAREPKPGEITACREHLAQVRDRDEAFEDILWALVNSTEFLYRQ
jgi:hypothetical protein